VPGRCLIANLKDIEHRPQKLINVARGRKTAIQLIETVESKDALKAAFHKAEKIRERRP
jgi:hypothetical protein